MFGLKAGKRQTERRNRGREGAPERYQSSLILGCVKSGRTERDENLPRRANGGKTCKNAQVAHVPPNVNRVHVRGRIRERSLEETGAGLRRETAAFERHSISGYSASGRERSSSLRKKDFRKVAKNLRGKKTYQDGVDAKKHIISQEKAPQLHSNREVRVRCGGG